jgi:hypothetical protein
VRQVWIGSGGPQHLSVQTAGKAKAGRNMTPTLEVGFTQSCSNPGQEQPSASSTLTQKGNAQTISLGDSTIHLLFQVQIAGSCFINNIIFSLSV